MEQCAQSNGILRKNDHQLVTLPCTLSPSPIPAVLLNRVESIQPVFNEIYHRVSLDHEFLQCILSPIMDKDDYIGNLWKIYTHVRDEGIAQDVFLGLNRSDYMLHVNQSKDEETQKLLSEHLCKTKTSAKYNVGYIPDNNWNILSIRQVEFNLMASGLCGLSERMVRQHRLSLSVLGYSPNHLKRLPSCPSSTGIADAMAEACNEYRSQIEKLDQTERNNNKKYYVLMVVAKDESNLYDQRAIMMSLIDRHLNVGVLARSFEDLISGHMHVDSNRRIFIDEQEVAVIYFRYGYHPTHFPDETAWNLKYILERSLAIKCPCIQYMLANTKLVQAALSKPDILARYIKPTNPNFIAVQSMFAGQYTLSEQFGLSSQVEIDQIIETCLANPELYVLKPQREGGGNNYFGDDLVKKLKEVIRNDECHSYIIMDRLNPYMVENYVLGGWSRPECLQKLVCELGIFGVFLGRGAKVILNKQTGHLLRSKPIDSNEGGIAAGFGCIDSPFLV